MMIATIKVLISMYLMFSFKESLYLLYNNKKDTSNNRGYISTSNSLIKLVINYNYSL